MEENKKKMKLKLLDRSEQGSSGRSHKDRFDGSHQSGASEGLNNSYHSGASGASRGNRDEQQGGQSRSQSCSTSRRHRSYSRSRQLPQLSAAA